MSPECLTVRKAVYDYVSENPQAPYDTVVDAVCETVGATQKQVCDEMDKMEKVGFLYLVNAEEATRVKAA